MNNEQKANEIAENESRFYKQLESNELTSSKVDCKKSALKMAEWKDQQLIQFLDNLKEESLGYADQKKAEIGRYVIDVIKGRLKL